MDAQIQTLAKEILETLKRKNLSLAAAESCTGGGIASALVSIAGASAAFKGSAVCYCDAAKTDILGVDKTILQRHFAESPQCAAAMALGAMRIYKSDVAISATGFLDANTPPQKKGLGGRVFFALAKKGAGAEAAQTAEALLDPAAGRNLNRAECVRRALELILNEIQK